MTDTEDIYQKGMELRREVLGNDYIDRSEANKSAFNEEFQELITRFAWGEVWTRPGIDRKTRSRMTLSILMALNRVDEFKLHVRAGINNGLTPDDIKEVIIHGSVYAGIPAAVSAFHWASEVLRELGEI